MDPLNKAEEIAASWKALAGSSRGDEGWMTIPVSLRSSCKLLAGRHYPGNEEAVLVVFSSFQMPAKGQLPEGRGFGVAEVSLGEQYGDHCCVALIKHSAGSIDMFTMMAADIVSMLEKAGQKDESQLFSLFLGRIRAWQEFMQRNQEGVLHFDAEVGLYGELLMLEMLIDEGLPAIRAVESWSGPLDGIQDFMLGEGAIEIKTTTRTGVFPARISSLEQLDDSLRKPLFLGAIRIQLSDSGSSLPARVDLVRTKISESDSSAIVEFELRLLHAGFFQSMAEKYTRHFCHTGTYVFTVNASIPKLVPANVPHGILKARYDIELDVDGAPSLKLSEVLHLLGVC
ncbi:MAG: PD-(D/E)XK motif protein [Deltaproteobacteria bacterium]|nr:PD-(D/E)XK motif protein [Deltaproteobacteria bacterium]